MDEIEQPYTLQFWGPGEDKAAQWLETHGWKVNRGQRKREVRFTDEADLHRCLCQLDHVMNEQLFVQSIEPPK
jgi:hypothetical protein